MTTQTQTVPAAPRKGLFGDWTQEQPIPLAPAAVLSDTQILIQRLSFWRLVGVLVTGNLFAALLAALIMRLLRS